uniref:GK21530 n=2 Tax=Drosophila willistoni TaxID=7260 RepID=B4MPX3_DROWI
MELFANDFEELGDNISVQNFFVFDGDFELAKGFEESVWNYFNIVVLSKHQPLVSGLLQEFRLQSNGLEIYTLINFHANLGNEFLSIDRFHYGRGYFRFSEYLILGSSLADRTNCKILELPLNTASTQGLSLMLVMPPKHMKLLELEEKFLSFTSRNFWRLPYQMRYTQVSVRLPNVRFTSKLNVGILVNEMSTMHLHKLFKMETQFNGMFDSAFNRRIKVKHFVQSINMQLLAPGIAQRKEPINSHNFFNVSQTFDCGEGPFLFLVRSRDVIYFIGHYRRIPKAFRAGTQFGQF